MFFDEEVLLEFRLNYLNEFVDNFVIVESTYTHSGRKRKLLFDINKFKKYKNKITYVVVSQEPPGLKKIYESDDENKVNQKYILNALKRENFQRNSISLGLKGANKEDYIMISDIDEIPNLENNNIREINKKLIFFKQKIFYYKFNLLLEFFDWHGTKVCKKVDLISPQWLRNVKDRNYPLWRIDTIFSKQKYSNIHFIENGGWHFSYLKTAKDIEKKLKSYLHHREYDVDPLGVEKIEEMIKGKKTIYDLRVDMRTPKFKGNHKLRTINIDLLPSYLKKNSGKYKEWLA
tara:strand:- start:893 stop:1762 length:870 start_codon:yes stop_codon:yes gene_type:complete